MARRRYFYPRGGGGEIIVSERFKQICERHAVKNACFVPAEEYSWDYYPHETKDWPIRIYDETLAVLRTMNKAGRLDDYVRAMEEMRKYVLRDPSSIGSRRCGNVLREKSTP